MSRSSALRSVTAGSSTISSIHCAKFGRFSRTHRATLHRHAGRKVAADISHQRAFRTASRDDRGTVFISALKSASFAGENQAAAASGLRSAAVTLTALHVQNLLHILECNRRLLVLVDSRLILVGVEFRADPFQTSASTIGSRVRRP